MLSDEERKARRDGWGIFKYRPTFPSLADRRVNDQLAFHRSQATIRVIIGSNRAGKTHPACAEVAALLLGEDYPEWWGWPAHATPKPPLVVWMMSPVFAPKPVADARIRKLFIGTWITDAASGERVFQPPFLPKSFLKDPGSLEREGARVFETTNDCMIVLKSSRQAVGAHAGEEPDLIFPDEPTEPPIWYELVGRVFTNPACRIVHTLTDVSEKNQTDYLDFLREKEGVEFFRFGGVNPHIVEEHKQKVMAFLPEEQQRIRGGGETVAEVRRCYPFANRWHVDFDPKKPEILNQWGGRGNWIPRERQWEIDPRWTRYVVHDPGVTNPGACAWIAVEPGLENLYVYRGLYWEEPYVDYMRTVHEIFATCAGEKIRAFYIDPKDMRKPQQFVGYTPRERLKIDLYNQAASRVLGRRFRWAMAPPSIEGMARSTRIIHMRAYLNPNHTSAPMLWFFDGDDKPMGDVTRKSWQDALKFECDKYHWAKSPKGRTNHPDKPVPKHNDFLYCVEVACAMGFRWQPDEGEDQCVVPQVRDPWDPGGKLRRFMEGDEVEDFGRVEFL